MISAITGRINNRAIIIVDVEVQPSEFTFESKSESVPDPDTTQIKLIDAGEMDHLLGFFH